MVNLHKLRLIASELGYTVESREIKGKLTRQHYYRVRHIVRKFNYYNNAPYGISPNGYAYTCGCIYDCCGCLIRRYATVVILSESFIISVHSSYNY